VPLYAAYGSNMHPEQMLERAPHSPMAGTGWLHGWRLTFAGEDIGWEGALATLVEAPDSSVFVVLYDMTQADEETLDRWEGSELGFHKKIRCRIERERASPAKNGSRPSGSRMRSGRGFGNPAMSVKKNGRLRR